MAQLRALDFQAGATLSPSSWISLNQANHKDHKDFPICLCSPPRLEDYLDPSLCHCGTVEYPMTQYTQDFFFFSIYRN